MFSHARPSQNQNSSLKKKALITSARSVHIQYTEQNGSYINASLIASTISKDLNEYIIFNRSLYSRENGDIVGHEKNAAKNIISGV